MANPNQDARSGRGQYVRTPETAQRDARAAELRAEGWTFQAIADELGFASKSRAQDASRRALRDIVQGPAEKLLAVEVARLEMITDEVLNIFQRDHVMVSHGKIIKDDDGNPLLDDSIKLAAADRYIKARESFRRLLGLDRPAKVEHSGGTTTLAELLTATKPKTDDADAG